MVINADKKMLVSMVCGQSPSYELLEHPEIKKLGTFWGSYDRWDWNDDALKQLTEKQLLDIYNILN